MRTPGVYAIVRLDTEHRYVGSSVNIAQRWKEHLSDLRRGLQPSKSFQRDWFELGEQAFAFVILEVVDGGYAARLDAERRHIKATELLYNASGKAGSGPRDGHRPTAEARAKMSAGVRAYRAAHPLTEEQRARISAAKKGKPHKSPAYHWTLSAETRARMSESRKNSEKYHASDRWIKAGATRKGQKRPAWVGEHVSAGKRAANARRKLASTLVDSPSMLPDSMAGCADAIAGGVVN